MADIKLDEIPVRDIIPQREPFVLIDKLLFCSDNETVTSFKVGDGCIFAGSGELATPGIIENMAQSCVAGAGYRQAFILHEPVKIGVIGSVRTLKVLRNPSVGETITTCISIKGQVGDITVSEATVKSGDEILATATLKTA